MKRQLEIISMENFAALATRHDECRWKAIVSTFMPHRQKSRTRQLFSPRTWIRFRRSYLLPKTQLAFTDEARAMLRALSRRRLRPQNACGSKVFTSDCCL